MLPDFLSLSKDATKACRGSRGAQSGIQKSNSSKMPKDGFSTVNSSGERLFARPYGGDKCRRKTAVA